MKKLNKKGFTLAELLIVIAIIAILIAIAIPTFAGALENAKRQTDHANMRNAYAMAQVANLQDGKFTDPNTGALVEKTGTLYFYKDGTLDSYNADKVYKLQAKHTTTGDCLSAVACKTAVTDANITAGYYIIVSQNPSNNNQWEVSVGAAPAGP